MSYFYTLISKDIEKLKRLHKALQYDFGEKSMFNVKSFAEYYNTAFGAVRLYSDLGVESLLTQFRLQGFALVDDDMLLVCIDGDRTIRCVDTERLSIGEVVAAMTQDFILMSYGKFGAFLKTCGKEYRQELEDFVVGTLPGTVAKQSICENAGTLYCVLDRSRSPFKKEVLQRVTNLPFAMWSTGEMMKSISESIYQILHFDGFDKEALMATAAFLEREPMQILDYVKFWVEQEFAYQHNCPVDDLTGFLLVPIGGFHEWDDFVKKLVGETPCKSTGILGALQTVADRTVQPDRTIEYTPQAHGADLISCVLCNCRADALETTTRDFILLVMTMSYDKDVRVLSGNQAGLREYIEEIIEPEYRDKAEAYVRQFLNS